MATTSTDVTSLTIIETILADVNAIVPNFSSLVNSYRLLVGAAEEVHRIAGASPDVLARAITRFDRTGELIDILIDLLCCKIAFSSELLALTCGPVDLFRLLANRFDVADTPHLVAEEILLLEIIRRALGLARSPESCVPPCTPPGPPPFTFATSYFVPPPPPPPPIPPEPPPPPPPPPPPEPTPPPVGSNEPEQGEESQTSSNQSSAGSSSPSGSPQREATSISSEPLPESIPPNAGATVTDDALPNTVDEGESEIISASHPAAQVLTSKHRRPRRLR